VRDLIAADALCLGQSRLRLGAQQIACYSWSCCARADRDLEPASLRFRSTRLTRTPHAVGVGVRQQHRELAPAHAIGSVPRPAFAQDLGDALEDRVAAGCPCRSLTNLKSSTSRSLSASGSLFEHATLTACSASRSRVRKISRPDGSLTIEILIRINYAYPEGMESVNGLVQEQIAQSPPPPIAGSCKYPFRHPTLYGSAPPRHISALHSCSSLHPELVEQDAERRVPLVVVHTCGDEVDAQRIDQRNPW
jgi:hypothetical protein